MMNGWFNSMGAGGWILMTVFWAMLIAVIVWAARALFAGGERAGSAPAEQPEEILDRRLASGEIDAATYDALRGTLREAHSGKA